MNIRDCFAKESIITPFIVLGCAKLCRLRQKTAIIAAAISVPVDGLAKTLVERRRIKQLSLREGHSDSASLTSARLKIYHARKRGEVYEQEVEYPTGRTVIKRSPDLTTQELKALIERATGMRAGEQEFIHDED